VRAPGYEIERVERKAFTSGGKSAISQRLIKTSAADYQPAEGGVRRKASFQAATEGGEAGGGLTKVSWLT